MAPPAATRPEVTRLLHAWSAGDLEARDALLPMIYADLRAQAARRLRRERRDHTLTPTALVHEAYLRLVGQDGVTWRDRLHFMGAAAETMRRVLIDHARRHRSAKRGGAAQRVTLPEGLFGRGPRDVDLLALDAALENLAAFDPRQARVVELRAFGGLSIDETAQALELSSATVKRDWTFAKAWLFRRLSEPAAESGQV